jgi:hypothetical protein
MGLLDDRSFDTKGGELGLFQRDRDLGLGRQSGEFGVKRYSTAVLPAWLTAISRYREVAAILGEDPETRITPCGSVAYDQIESGFNENGPFLASLVGLDRIENWSASHLRRNGRAKNAGWTGSSRILIVNIRVSPAPSCSVKCRPPRPFISTSTRRRRFVRIRTRVTRVHAAC